VRITPVSVSSRAGPLPGPRHPITAHHTSPGPSNFCPNARAFNFKDQFGQTSISARRGPPLQSSTSLAFCLCASWQAQRGSLTSYKRCSQQGGLLMMLAQLSSHTTCPDRMSCASLFNWGQSAAVVSLGRASSARGVGLASSSTSTSR